MTISELRNCYYRLSATFPNEKPDKVLDHFLMEVCTRFNLPMSYWIELGKAPKAELLMNGEVLKLRTDRVIDLERMTDLINKYEDKGD